MNGKSSFFFVFVLAVLVMVLGVLAGSVATATSWASPTPTVYTDPVGDSNGARDITNIAVSNSGGVVTFSITATGLTATPATDVFFVFTWLDTDRNPATGDPLDGTDYAFVTYSESSGSFSYFLKWDGSTWISMDPTATMTYGSSGDTFTVTFSSADFGGTTAFDFYLDSELIVGIPPPTGWDFAPDNGWWTYSLSVADTTPPVLKVPADMTVAATSATGATVSFNASATDAVDPAPVVVCVPASGSTFAVGDTTVTCTATDASGNHASASFGVHVTAAPSPSSGGGGSEPSTPVTPVETTATPPLTPPVVVTPVVVKALIGKPVTVPAKVIAGRNIAVSFRVTRSDTHRLLTTGKMICDPSIKGKVIKHREQFKNGIATLRFMIPRDAKGKQLKVHLTIKLGSQSVTRVSAFQIS